mgnify:CR=1 FL=1
MSFDDVSQSDKIHTPTKMHHETGDITTLEKGRLVINLVWVGFCHISNQPETNWFMLG